MGLCLGGALTAMLAAHMAATGDKRINSLTLLNTLLDYSKPGILGNFTDEQTVAQLERQGETGVLDGARWRAPLTSCAPTTSSPRRGDEGSRPSPRSLYTAGTRQHRCRPPCTPSVSAGSAERTGPQRAHPAGPGPAGITRTYVVGADNDRSSVGGLLPDRRSAEGAPASSPGRIGAAHRARPQGPVRGDDGGVRATRPNGARPPPGTKVPGAAGRGTPSASGPDHRWRSSHASTRRATRPSPGSAGPDRRGHAGQYRPRQRVRASGAAAHRLPSGRAGPAGLDRGGAARNRPRAPRRGLSSLPRARPDPPASAGAAYRLRLRRCSLSTVSGTG